MLRFNNEGSAHTLVASSPAGDAVTITFAPTTTPIIPATPAGLAMMACMYHPLTSSMGDPIGSLLSMLLKKFANRCAARLYLNAPDPDPYRWQSIVASGSAVPSQVYRAMVHHQALTRSKPRQLPIPNSAKGQVNAGALMALISWLDSVGTEHGKVGLGRREFEFIIRNSFTKQAPIRFYPDFAWLAERLPDSARSDYSWEEARDLTQSWFASQGLELEPDLVAEALCRNASRAPLKVQRRREHEKAVAERLKPKPSNMWGEAVQGWD